MMKKLLAVIAVLALGWALSPARADPLPSCPPTNEQLLLAPTSASFNGQPATSNGPGSGVYSTDAGVRFFVAAAGELDAVPVAGSTTCPPAPEQVTVRVVDPWTGERLTLSVRGTP